MARSSDVSVEHRVKRVFSHLTVQPDLILLQNASEPFIDDNFFYVTGLDQGLFEGSTALLYPDGGLDLIVSELEAETAKHTDAHLHTYKKKETSNGLFQPQLASATTIGINFAGIAHQQFMKLLEQFPSKQFIDVSDAFTKSRAIKDATELAHIKRACHIADQVMEKIPELTRESLYEYELAAEIGYLLQKHGADKPAFDIISSFGAHTAEPHYTHGKTRLHRGDLVLCDFGACFKKYNSDITRAFIFGSPSKQQQDMYDTVLEAQEIGIETARAGINACDVHRAVSKYIEKSPFAGRFIHSTGHSLGLAVHDGGIGFTDECTDILQEHMVLTIEPGVYLPGIGGVRIEDDVLIKKQGVEFLTTASKAFRRI
ncbi:MAG: aminopeptidase P family protein [Candidatus Thermoplasmatota archaeon]|nr:aminopeptidase P family protein [Candidatus Thermoplasmatota archaeon]